MDVLESSRAALTQTGTGREAILAFFLQCLQVGESGATAWSQCERGPLETGTVLRPVLGLASGTTDILKLLRARFLRSVEDGELPEDADIEVLVTLCLMMAESLLFALSSGAGLLNSEEALRFFTDRLGFHQVRPTRRKAGRNRNPH